MKPFGKKVPAAHEPSSTGEQIAASITHTSGRLGSREREVLEIVWRDGSVTVGQVSRHLSIPLAYTTVMTTLDRLFKKGLLRREKQERAFLYSPAVTPSDVESFRARALLDRFFDHSRSDPDVLLSCLVDVIGSYDNELLQSLEEKVKAAKLQSEAQGASPK